MSKSEQRYRVDHMETFVEMLLVGAIVEMQERFFHARPISADMKELLDLSDDVLSAMGYDASDWGPYTIIDGWVRPVSVNL